jgi:hypothetical protein
MPPTIAPVYSADRSSYGATHDRATNRTSRCARGSTTLSIRLGESGSGREHGQNCASKYNLLRHVMNSSFSKSMS